MTAQRLAILHPDGTPLESRQIRPGVTAQFQLRPDHVVVIQAAPGFGPAGPEFSDGES